MLCTNCTNKIKPIVAVDIDGTIGDYHGHFVEFAQRYIGPPYHEALRLEEKYDGRAKFSEWFCDRFGISLTEFRQIKLAYRQGAQKRSMPLYAGAPEMVKAFRAAGAEVWIATTRPYLRIDNIDPDTRAWLDRHGFEFDGLIYDEFKYERLAEMIDPARVAAVAEDLRERVDEATRLFNWECVMWRRTIWNRGYGEGGFNTIKQLEIEGVKMIERWKQENG